MQRLYPINSEFKKGVIGEINYSEEQFDVIIAMDAVYFAKDMTDLISQVKSWLKKDGVIILFLMI